VSKTLFQIARMVVAAAIVLHPLTNAALAEPAAGGELTVTFDRKKPILGVDTGVEILVRAKEAVDALQIAASVGTVEQVERLDERRFKGRLIPPSEDHPQVAIVTARATVKDRSLVGWRALPLWGRWQVEVKRWPGARTTVRVGDQSFGPVKADKEGKATVPLVLAPGIRHARVGRKRIELDPPPPPVKRLFGWVTPERVGGAAVSTVQLHLFAVQPDGSRYTERRTPTVRFTKGSYGSARRLGAGAWQLPLTVPAGETEELLVSASLPEGEEDELELKVNRVKKAVVANPAPPPATRPAQKEIVERKGLRPHYFWVGLGVSGALLTAGFVTRVMALEVSDEYNNPYTNYQRQLELQPRGQDLTTVSTVLLAVGGAAALGTAVLYWLTDFPEETRITPTAGPRSAGVVLSTTF
jgi:hypothetical protein